MQNVFADKNLFLHFHHFHDAAFGKNYNIIQVWTFKQQFIFFQTSADKTLLPVDIHFGICHSHLLGLDHFQLFDLCFAFPAFTIFLQQVFIIGNSKVNQVIQIIFYLFDICFQCFDLCIQFFNIQPVNTTNRFFCQLKNILPCYGSFQLFFKRNKCFVNCFNHFIPCLMFLF